MRAEKGGGGKEKGNGRREAKTGLKADSASSDMGLQAVERLPVPSFLLLVRAVLHRGLEPY